MPYTSLLPQPSLPISYSGGLPHPLVVGDHSPFPTFDLTQTSSIKDQILPFGTPFEDPYHLYDDHPSLPTLNPDLFVQTILNTQDAPAPNPANTNDMRSQPGTNWRTHTMVALLTSAALFLNWYLVLERVNKPGAGTLLVLFSTIPVDAIFLAVLSHFTQELWQVPVLEKTIRPKLSAFFNMIGVTAITPAFRSANGLPYYFKDRINVVLRALMFEHETIDVQHYLRQIDKLDQSQGLDETTRGLKSRLELAIAENTEYLTMLKAKFDQFLKKDAPQQPENPGKKAPINSHVLTFSASVAVTLSTCLYLFGLPDPAAMQNTFNLLIFFFTKVFLVGPVTPIIHDLMVVPVYEYLARPQLVSSAKRADLDGFFPSLDGILGIPPHDRWLYSFDMFTKGARVIHDRYQLELYLLEQNPHPSGLDMGRIADLKSLLPRFQQALDEIDREFTRIKVQ